MLGSLTYILLGGVWPSVGGISCPPRGAGRSGYRASARSQGILLTAYFVMPRIRKSVRVLSHSDRPVGTKGPNIASTSIYVWVALPHLYSFAALSSASLSAQRSCPCFDIL